MFDFRCTAGPDDTPFAEQHRLSLDLLCAQGQLWLPTAAAGCSNWWRDRSWSAIPATNIPAPTIIVCGDECLSFFLAPELVEAIGDRAEIWRIGAAPPLPELMVLGELAQAAADGRSDVGLDEIGHAVRQPFCRGGFRSGRQSRSRSRRGIAAARWKPRSGSMRIRTGRSTWSTPPRRPGSARSTSCGCFRSVLGVTPHQYLVRSRLRHAARLLGRRRQSPITDVAYDVGFADLSNFVRTFHRAAGVSPRRFREASRGMRKIFQERLALH